MYLILIANKNKQTESLAKRVPLCRTSDVDVCEGNIYNVDVGQRTGMEARSSEVRGDGSIRAAELLFYIA
jgi:hypothetical protein